MTDPPGQVQVTGQPEALQGALLAMVGTRRATPRGLAFARALASALAVRGWTIVSGLALGIDAAAHQGALDVGGSTVAVMATGPDRTYPHEHQQLRREIEAAGCCLTEFAEGAAPRRFHFPRRNRLIASLCQGVVVVEAPSRSGALSTAYLALDYNREVFAVPGPVDLESSRGCHRLLKEGAHLVTSAEDIHAVLKPPAPRSSPRAEGSGVASAVPDRGTAARWIFDRLDFEGVSREQLRGRWAGSEQAWMEALLALELAGLIQRLPGGGLARKIW
jgi:DNA processing protein